MNFYKKVYFITKKIPRGKVATYGQIASLIYSPRAARAVGFALRALPSNTSCPWQRVINSRGQLSIVNPKFTAKLQASLLRKEGIKVKKEEDTYIVDLKKYLFDFKNVKPPK